MYEKERKLYLYTFYAKVELNENEKKIVTKKSE